MYTGKTKKFRDTIHGYIEIPEVIVSNIIDTELFQRLRHIEQTSMRPLYPAARHDRFIHSLGVYWLGKQAFLNFRKNATKELEKINLPIDRLWWDKQEVLFSLGCLLHDCAHAPFSHTLEALYELRKIDLSQDQKDMYGLDHNITRIPELDFHLISVCSSSDSNFAHDFMNTPIPKVETKGLGAAHEKMSSYCVMKYYREAIEKIMQELVRDENNNPVTLESEDFVFIVRMIIGCVYTERNNTNTLKNCIISMLNSSSIDVDGLDYIVRDAYMSGIDNFSIDYQRLLSSFTIVPVRVYKNHAISHGNIDGIWLKGSKICITNFRQGTIKGLITIEGLTPDNKDNVVALGKNINIIADIYTSTSDTTTQFNSLRNGTLFFNESCLAEQSLLDATIIEGRKVVSLETTNLDRNDFEFLLGYDKNSLSIIQSTISARNHEYLWVYTHPKVLYSSNYLQWELMRDCAKYLCCCANQEHFANKKLKFNCENCRYCKEPNRITSEEDYILFLLGYETYFHSDYSELVNTPDSLHKKMMEKGFVFYRTSDDDINELFKKIHIQNACRGKNKSEKLEKDFNEYFSRSHRKPLWKSFIEYEKFIQSYLEDHALRSAFRTLCTKTVSGASLYKNNYCEFKAAQQKILNKYGLKDGLIIKSAVKTKELNPSETFIKFKDRTYRLSDLFEEGILKEKISKEFYYIFANKTKDLTKNDYAALIKELDSLDT